MFIGNVVHKSLLPSDKFYFHIHLELNSLINTRFILQYPVTTNQCYLKGAALESSN